MKLISAKMSEAEKQTVQENSDKDDHCYLAWKMDLKFREILNKKTPNYLQHLKSLPSHDATDSVYQRTKWSHNSMHPPPVHNFLKKLKGCAENPDWKSDGISDTDSVRTEDFESRFTELLVPVSSIGSESQDTIDAADGADMDDCNDIPIGEELLEGVVSINHPPVANADSSDVHKWKNPTVAAKHRYEPDLMISKSFNKEEVKNPVSKKEQIPDTKTQKIENHNISSPKLETAKFDESLESFQPLPKCSQGKLWQLVNEMPTQADKNQTFQENILKQKVEQLVGENIKLGAEKALLADELKEMKDKREHGGAASKLKKLQEDCSKLRADNHVLASNSTELNRKLDDQLKNVSELTQQKNQYSNRIVQLENNNQILMDNIAKLNKQLEQNAVKINDLEDQVKDLKEQLCHEKELYETEKQEHLKSMTTLEKQSKEFLSQRQNDHKQELEKLESASNAERDALVEKYELRLAKQVATHTSQDAIKESQISSLKSNLVKLKSEQDCERQRWKQILAKNDDSRKKKKERCQPVDSEVTDQPQNHNKELHDQLERANKQISNLNTINQQLYLRIGHLREELSKLREIYKPWQEEGLWEISGTRDIRAHPNQLMIQNLKDKITKEMHIEVLSLMQRLHQQEDELVYIKSMWNKMLKNLHLFERDGNNSTVFDTDKLEILIAGLLNEESHLNMNILGIQYLSRLTSVCGRSDNGKDQPPLIDKPTVAQYLHEPIKTAFTRLHSTTQQLRDLVKSLSKMDLQNPSIQLYSARQTDSIRSEFTRENANQEQNVFRPFIGISSSSYGCSANGFDEESQRMILLECDLNHQAKVLLELMRSYNGLQEALVASHSSRQTQKEMRKNCTKE